MSFQDFLLRASKGQNPICRVEEKIKFIGKVNRKSPEYWEENATKIKQETITKNHLEEGNGKIL